MGGNYGGHEDSRVDPDTHIVGGEEGGREASGVAENPGGGRHGVGGGVESPQDDSTPNRVGEGVESPQDDSTPREAEGKRGDETPGSLKSSQYQQGEDGQGRGGGDKNPPTAQATRGKGPDGGDGTAQSGHTATPSEAMETAAGDGGEGHLPENFDSADGATTEKGKHPRREYDNVVSEALERGQASAGPAAGEDGHGATVHSAGRIRA